MEREPGFCCEPGQAHLRGQPPQPGLHNEPLSGTNLCEGDIVDRMPGARPTGSAAAESHRALCGRESHVDRSIRGPEDFIRTNVDGTFALLEETFERIGESSATGGGRGLPFSACFHRRGIRFAGTERSAVFREHSLRAEQPVCGIEGSLRPSGARVPPHLYGLPTLTTNCSNNYGRYQFPEKLIPLVILNALNGKPLPVYGDGQNVRDWLYVEDHCEAIATVLQRGQVGQTYNIGGWNEKRNLDIVKTICDIVDELAGVGHAPRQNLITFVKDRPGHDRRYAMDATKIERELSWRPKETFETGIRKTVKWYLENQEWVQGVISGSYRKWIETQYSS
jgi:dTDP-glucose 4,6-dehydratase